MKAVIQRLSKLMHRLFWRSPASCLNSNPIVRKVSLIIIDLVIASRGGRRLSEVLGWNNPDSLAYALIQDLREICYGIADIQIAEHILVDEFLVKGDGFRYSCEQYLQAWANRAEIHQPDVVDYHALLAGHDLVAKIDADAIDEVWTISYPYAGFYESRMVGLGAYWCNAPPLEDIGSARRRFLYHGL